MIGLADDRLEERQSPVSVTFTEPPEASGLLPVVHGEITRGFHWNRTYGRLNRDRPPVIDHRERGPTVAMVREDEMHQQLVVSRGRAVRTKPLGD